MICRKICFFRFKLASLIAKNYSYSGVEKSLLTQPCEKSFQIKLGSVGKYFRVGLEANVKTVLAVCVSDAFEVARNVSLFETHGVPLALVAVVYFHPFGKRVYNGSSDAVKTSGYFVTLTAEFSSGVKYGENHRKSRNPHFVMYLRRNSASVVLYRYASVGMKYYLDTIAVSRHRLVD